MIKIFFIIRLTENKKSPFIDLNYNDLKYTLTQRFNGRSIGPNID